MGSFRFAIAISILVLPIAGQAQESPQSSFATAAPASVQSTTASQAQILIGRGDLLDVTVYGAPDFNKEVRVSSTGDVSLPLLGSVHLAGLTIEQAQTLVAKQLSDKGLFNEPQVSIFEKEYATQGISVLGEVQKPGIYPLMGPRKLYDSISAAGGLTPKAGTTASISHRDGSSAQTVPIAGEEPKNNVDVMPGDTVVVSKAPIVYVVGDVHKPSGIVMDKPQMTVLQAIALAEGTNPTAALNRAKVIRKTGGRPQEIPIQLKAILSSKAPDPLLEPDDILFVPTSTAKSAGRRGLEAVVQAATGVAIYRHP